MINNDDRQNWFIFWTEDFYAPMQRQDVTCLAENTDLATYLITRNSHKTAAQSLAITKFPQLEPVDLQTHIVATPCSHSASELYPHQCVMYSLSCHPFCSIESKFAEAKTINSIMVDSVAIDSITVNSITADSRPRSTLSTSHAFDSNLPELKSVAAQSVETPSIGTKSVEVKRVESTGGAISAPVLAQEMPELLSRVSHELRSPLANIQMAIDRLGIMLDRSGMLDSNQTQITYYFQLLEGECRRGVTLINDLLTLSRLEALAEPLDPTPIDLKHWLPHLTEPFLDRIYLSQQTLSIKLPDELPILNFDLVNLERIFSELVHNACKYTPAGGQISVTAWLEPDISQSPASQSEAALSSYSPSVLLALGSTQSAIAICVSNSGNELDPTELPRIFDRFYRVQNQYYESQEGSGLGLAIVKKRMEYLGGSIQVESASQQVSFTVRFPILSV